MTGSASVRAGAASPTAAAPPPALPSPRSARHPQGIHFNSQSAQTAPHAHMAPTSPTHPPPTHHYPGDPVVVELFEDLVPAAAREFRLRCSGAGTGRLGEISYEGSSVNSLCVPPGPADPRTGCRASAHLRPPAPSARLGESIARVGGLNRCAVPAARVPSRAAGRTRGSRLGRSTPATPR